MMNYALSFGIIGAIVLVLCVNNASSINCYLCESELGDSCGYFNNLTFTNLTKTNCPPEETECSVHVELEPGYGGSKIRRGCAKPGYCKNTNSSVISQCKGCRTDFCNSAPSTIPSVIAVGFLSLFLIKLVI